MSLSSAYGPADDQESLQVLAKALELGCTFWDSAAVYGFGHNEQLIGRFIKENPDARDKLFIASKCGWDVSLAWTASGHCFETRRSILKRRPMRG